MMRRELVIRLTDFMDEEARSCSMDLWCATPLYVYRMWGGEVPIEEISVALKELKSSGWGL